MPFSVGIYTLGCKVSQYESIVIGERFAELGFTLLPFEEKCDVYVINTCTVTAESDRKCRQIIRRAAKQGALVLVCGCYSQVAPEELEKIKRKRRGGHRLTCRVTCRLEDAEYAEVVKLVREDGFDTIQAWLAFHIRKRLAARKTAESNT